MPTPDQIQIQTNFSALYSVVDLFYIIRKLTGKDWQLSLVSLDQAQQFTRKYKHDSKNKNK